MTVRTRKKKKKKKNDDDDDEQQQKQSKQYIPQTDRQIEIAIPVPHRKYFK